MKWLDWWFGQRGKMNEEAFSLGGGLIKDREANSVAHLGSGELLLDGGVLVRVADHVVDEPDRTSSPGAEGPSRDGVDANLVLRSAGREEE